MTSTTQRPQSDSNASQNQTHNHNQNQPTTATRATQQTATHKQHDLRLRRLAQGDESTTPRDWPDLRKHIQSKLKAYIHSAFPLDPIPKLHPQAHQIKQEAEEKETEVSNSAQERGNGNQGQKESESSKPDEQNPTPTPTPTATATDSLNQRFVSQSSGLTEQVKQSSNPTEADQGTPSNPENPNTTFHIPGIGPIESSMFFPSKRQPGKERNHMWSKNLSKEELDKEVEDLCEMLDIFQDSPPFTIQRLSELILEPKLYHTPTKYLSSIRRVLSVTAEMGSFPVLDPNNPTSLLTCDSDSTSPNANGVNGILTSGIHSQGSSSQALHPNSLFQSSSHPNTHPNSSSYRESGNQSDASSDHGSSNGSSSSNSSPRIPYKRTNDPIFSPIPFLVRERERSSDEKEEEEIERIDLGPSKEEEREEAGKDQVGVESREKSDLQASSSISISHESENVDADADVDVNVDHQMQIDPIQKTGASGKESLSSTPIESSNAPNTPIASNNTPLGVPLGRVDELDDVPKPIRTQSHGHGQNQTQPPGRIQGQDSRVEDQRMSLMGDENEKSFEDEQPISASNEAASSNSSSSRGKLSSESEINPISSTTTVSKSHGHGDEAREIKRMKSNSSFRASDRQDQAGNGDGDGEGEGEGAGKKWRQAGEEGKEGTWEEKKKEHQDEVMN